MENHNQRKKKPNYNVLKQVNSRCISNPHTRTLNQMVVLSEVPRNPYRQTAKIHQTSQSCSQQSQGSQIHATPGHQRQKSTVDQRQADIRSRSKSSQNIRHRMHNPERVQFIIIRTIIGAEPFMSSLDIRNSTNIPTIKEIVQRDAKNVAKKLKHSYHEHLADIQLRQ